MVPSHGLAIYTMSSSIPRVSPKVLKIYLSLGRFSLVFGRKALFDAIFLAEFFNFLIQKLLTCNLITV